MFVVIEKNHNGGIKKMIKLKLKFFKRREPFLDWESYQELIDTLDDLKLLDEASKNIFKGD